MAANSVERGGGGVLPQLGPHEEGGGELQAIHRGCHVAPPVSMPVLKGHENKGSPRSDVRPRWAYSKWR